MPLRICQKCKKSLEVEEFSPNKQRVDKLCVWCKACNRVAMQEWRAEKRETGELKLYRKKYYLKEYCEENREGVKKKNRERAKKCKNSWWSFFKEYYGDYPKCSVCNKELKWWNTNDEKSKKSNAVCFDHRNGGYEVIRVNPSLWCSRNPVNDKNIKIWLSCNFGMLCHLCNSCLPTKNRIAWLKKPLRYARETV